MQVRAKHPSRPLYHFNDDQSAKSPTYHFNDDQSTPSTKFRGELA